MKTKLICLMLCLGSVIPLISAAQNASQDIASIQQKFSASIQTRFKNYPQEKAFVHVSQSVFLGGQTIWYKAYALAYGKPSDLSKVVYVRLSDQRGRMIKQDKLPLKNSTAWGSMDLPDTLHSGWYRLQAFTAWMLNFDRNDIFSQVLYIQNPAESVNPEKLTADSPNSFHITFYPEGGKLIDGTVANIAFRAEDSNGMPVVVTGAVSDAQKNTLANLTTVHDGMGSFSFETRSDAVYTAQVRFPDSSVQNITLPKAESAGITMRVNPGPAGEIDLAFAAAGQTQPVQNVLVLAVQDNGVAVSYPLQLSRGINVIGFDKKSFSAGILHFGLFDTAGHLIGERSVFVDRSDPAVASIKADSLSIIKGAENALTFAVHTAQGHSLQANLSVSVTDADMGNAVSDNLGSFVQLSAETASYIPDAGYYFKNNSDSLRRQLDLLMLTSQAHYNKWEDLTSGKPVPLAHAVEQSQFIAGRVEKYNPADNLKLKMMITSADSGKVVAFVEPDNKGIFKLDNFDSPGNADVLYEAVNRKNHKTDVEVTFFNENMDTVSIGPGKLKQAVTGNPGINIAYIDSAAAAQLAYEQASGIMLKTVKVNEVRKDPVQKMVDSHVKLYTEENAYNFDPVDQPTIGGQSVIDYLIGRVPGLKILVNSDSISWEYHGRSNLGVGTPNAAMKPYFYIDEVYAREDDIKSMNMNDVALIRFIPPPVWFAPLQGGFIGALMIYTKNRDDYANSYQTAHAESQLLNQYTFNGYSAPREFSATTTANTGPKARPGFSTTIFWAHDVQTDSKGIARLHFTANGKTKRYRVIVQGMDKDGRPIYAEQVFTAGK